MRHRRKGHELKLDPAMILPVKTLLNGGVGWEDALKQDVAAIICFPCTTTSSDLDSICLEIWMMLPLIDLTQ